MADDDGPGTAVKELLYSAAFSWRETAFSPRPSARIWIATAAAKLTGDAESAISWWDIALAALEVIKERTAPAT
jgi:hypothetical protein